jgi:fructokinase
MTFGGIEIGGTKCVCGTSVDTGDIVKVKTFATSTPDETIQEALDFFIEAGPINALGIGSFGPIDVNPTSRTWGHITATPKRGWTDVDVVSPFTDALNVPVAFDTDVNAAALGEWIIGSAAGVNAFCYVTVGTGIGGGVLLRGEPLHGLLHPEIGHIRIPHDFVRDPFEGSCRFHGDCLEGLASGESLRRRWGVPAEDLTADSAWSLEADYLALGLANLVCAISPEMIILGGGVTQHRGLIEMIRIRVVEFLAEYVRVPAFTKPGAIDQYLVSPGLGDHAGLHGALELARRSYERPNLLLGATLT